MAAAQEEIQSVPASEPRAASGPDQPATEDVEILPADEPDKSYYNKLSVWLMVLFSGLAIGSDG